MEAAKAPEMDTKPMRATKEMARKKRLHISATDKPSLLMNEQTPCHRSF
jgi:hypothetical protein